MRIAEIINLHPQIIIKHNQQLLQIYPRTKRTYIKTVIQWPHLTRRIYPVLSELNNPLQSNCSSTLCPRSKLVTRQKIVSLATRSLLNWGSITALWGQGLEVVGLRNSFQIIGTRSRNCTHRARKMFRRLQSLIPLWLEMTRYKTNSTRSTTISLQQIWGQQFNYHLTRVL